MKSPKQLHDESMKLYQTAIIAKHTGDMDKYYNLLGNALLLETEAANMLLTNFEAEPTRGFLFRGAATLALQSGKHAEAERLVACGLMGYPSDEVKNELREMFDRVNFDRHLALNGIKLSDEEFRFVIHGPKVISGYVRSEDYTDRVVGVQEAYLRTCERKKGRSYRSGGKASKSASSTSLYQGERLAASYAVIFKIVSPFDYSKSIPLLDVPAQTKYLDEMLECFSLLNEGKNSELRDRIGDENYYVNFVNAARTIAPDGEGISMTGFTVVRDNMEKKIAITRTKSEIEVWQSPIQVVVDEIDNPVIEEHTGNFQDIVGTKDLLYFIAKKKSHKITIPNDALQDIVKKHFKDEITIVVKRYKDRMELLDIR